MAFPKITNYKDKNTQIVTVKTSKGYVTSVNSLDGTINVFTSAPAQSLLEAENKHTECMNQIEDGKLGYFETVIEDD